MRAVLVWVFVGVLTGIVTPVSGDFGDVVFQFSGPAGTPSGLCYDGQNICVVDTLVNTIFKYDPNNGQGAGSLIIGAGWFPGGLGWDSLGYFFWMGENFTRTIKKIHPETGIELGSIPAPASSNQDVSGVGCRSGNVWSTNRSSPSAAYEQDPVTGMILTSFSAPGSEASGLAFDGLNVWIADTQNDSIYKVAQDGTVEAGFPAPGNEPKGVGFDGSYLWNVDAGTGQIYKIDISQPGIGESDRRSLAPAVKLELYPNPFRSTTTVRLIGNRSKDALQISALQIYDLAGRLVGSYDWRADQEDGATLVWHGVDSQGRAVSSGVYFFRVGVGTTTFSRAAYLVK